MENSTIFNCALWAKSNPKPAALIIALSKIAIGIIAFIFGISAFWAGLELEPKIWGWALQVIAVLCLLIYPAKSLKKSIGRPKFFLYRKAMDACLVAYGFAFWFFIGNALPNWVDQPVMSAAISTPLPTVFSMAGSRENPAEARPVKSGGLVHKWVIKRAKSKLKHIIAKMDRLQEKDMTVPVKIFLTFVFVALAIGLGYLSLVLGCEISCSGQEVLGTTIMIGGPLLFGFLGGLAIYKIWKKKKVVEGVPDK